MPLNCYPKVACALGAGASEKCPPPSPATPRAAVAAPWSGAYGETVVVTAPVAMVVAIVQVRLGPATVTA